METEFLNLFWKLSSLQEDERVCAAKDMLELLKGFKVGFIETTSYI